MRANPKSPAKEKTVRSQSNEGLSDGHCRTDLNDARCWVAEDKHVRGFEIPVQYPIGVEVVDAIQQLP